MPTCRLQVGLPVESFNQLNRCCTGTYRDLFEYGVLNTGLQRTLSLLPTGLREAQPSVARPREGLGVWTPPPLSSGATHEICAEPMRKYWGTPSPRNVVPSCEYACPSGTSCNIFRKQFHVQLVGFSYCASRSFFKLHGTALRLSLMDWD